jgi:hypothetical protein
MTGRSSRGFTLVELMVAITGGLFLSIIVFVLARDGSRFYQREMRVANATLGGIVGFERLRADITRAGFLTSPNVLIDQSLCGAPLTDPSWPKELQHTASLRLAPGGPPESAILNANGRTPDSIVLAGSFTSADQFPIRTVIDNGPNYQVYLQRDSGAMARLGIFARTDDDDADLLRTVFRPGRALRLVDKSGMTQFGTIQEVTSGDPPIVTLTKTPTLRFRGVDAGRCGLKGYETGALANVVNFVRYDVRKLKTPAFKETLYATNEDRTELARVELDTFGNEIDGTEELVAEYAVDLAFGITVADGIDNGTGTITGLTTFEADTDNDAAIVAWAGDTLGQVQRPQRVKSVRVRLSVRSREGDREADIVPGLGVAAGFYRIGLGPDGTAPFARVRTMQADIALRNQMGAI